MIAEKWSDDTAIYYVYNANGIAGFVYNGIPYVYQKNVFGDIVAIYNNAGGKVAGYRYNAYGECYIYNPELTSNSNGSTIAEINPFRYRGYYYDTESGLYYLQSRYYDPAIGRFLNADTVDYLEPESITGINLYAYCENNPVMYVDIIGKRPTRNISYNINTRWDFGIGLLTPSDYQNNNVEAYAFFAKGSVGFGYSKTDGYSFLSLYVGIVDMTLHTQKFFNNLSKDDIRNPNLFIGFGALNAGVSAGIGASATAEIVSGAVGLQFGDALSISAKAYVGAGVVIDFSKGIRAGGGFPFGFEISINFDWGKIF